MKPGRMRAKALRVVARGRSVECELGAWGLKDTGYRVAEDRDGLRVSIYLHGEMITNQYSILAIKSYGQWLTTLGGID